MSGGGDTPLACDMDHACTAPITMLDRKGYIYCTPHGLDRRTLSGIPCRKLLVREIAQLKRGEQIAKY
jgi:hypothetical protein